MGLEALSVGDWAAWRAAGASPALRTLLATALALWLLSRARRSLWLLSLVALPGTFCHELCHHLTGLLLNGQPRAFTVFPKREGNRWILGSVQLANARWYNRFFIGLAPLLLLPAAAALFFWRIQTPRPLTWAEAGWIYLIANLLFACLPSLEDLRMAAKSPIGWLLLLAALAWGWWRVHATDPKAVLISIGARAKGVSGMRIEWPVRPQVL